MSRKPLIAGNWKMNLNHIEAVTLVQKLAWTLDDANFDFDKTEVAVFPPFTDIRSVQSLIEGDKFRIEYGGQDISAHDSGAYTGEISGSFLAKLNAAYVLVGHSERRTYHGETDEVCAAKVQAEPVWAIGTGKVATAEDAQEMAAAIRAELTKLYSADVANQVRVLYGGSVKSSSAPSIMEQADVDGVLVGGASLQADEFAAIARFDA